MYNKVAFSNNYNICSEDQLLNVYVMYDGITVRILQPYTGDTLGFTPSPFSDLNTHDMFGDEEFLAKNPERVFVNEQGEMYSINYQTFIKRSDVREWVPYAEVALYISASNKTRTKPSYAQYKKMLSFDRIPRTYLNKKLSENSRRSFFYNHAIETQLTRVIDFVVYKDGLDFDSCPMCIFYNKLLYTNVNIEYTGNWFSANEGEISDTEWRTETFSPKFKFDDSVTEIPADGRITLDVELYNNAGLPVNDRSFTLEAISGYLPHKRLNIVNGKGSFDVIALGMKAGDELRIKINDRFFTSRGEKILTVV